MNDIKNKIKEVCEAIVFDNGSMITDWEHRQCTSCGELFWNKPHSQMMHKSDCLYTKAKEILGEYE